MDLETLKAEHPKLYAAILQTGIDTGITRERDRVAAHLTMGTQSGDMKTAMTAIEDGSEMTQKLQATYMAASMNRSDVDARNADDSDAGDGSQDVDDEDIQGQQVADMVEAKLGGAISG